MARGCRNCGRDKVCVCAGLCNICYHAASGKSGEARDTALAEVKQKIAAGEIRSREQKQKAVAAPPGPAQPPAESRPAVAYPKPAEVHLAGESPRVVPVTLRLAIEITVRVATVTA
ncbi:MAG: hypothetical protein ACYC7J_18440 [Syntrophales bacterium]